MLRVSKRLFKSKVVDTRIAHSLDKNAGLAAAAAEQAGRYFDQGYNCAQSVYKAAADVLQIEAPSELVCGLSALTGGIGNAGCSCGALVGASMLLGTSKTSPERPTKGKRAYNASGAFHDIFKAEFKSTCCRVLRKNRDLKDKQANEGCKHITERTTELLIETILEKM